jgi:hypothetical protein
VSVCDANEKDEILESEIVTVDLKLQIVNGSIISSVAFTII